MEQTSEGLQGKTSRRYGSSKDTRESEIHKFNQDVQRLGSKGDSWRLVRQTMIHNDPDARYGFQGIKQRVPGPNRDDENAWIVYAQLKEFRKLDWVAFNAAWQNECEKVGEKLHSRMKEAENNANTNQALGYSNALIQKPKASTGNKQTASSLSNVGNSCYLNCVLQTIAAAAQDATQKTRLKIPTSIVRANTILTTRNGELGNFYKTWLLRSKARHKMKLGLSPEGRSVLDIAMVKDMYEIIARNKTRNKQTNDHTDTTTQDADMKADLKEVAAARMKKIEATRCVAKTTGTLNSPASLRRIQKLLVKAIPIGYFTPTQITTGRVLVFHHRDLENKPLYVDSNEKSVEKSEVTFFEKAVRLDYEKAAVDLWNISKGLCKAHLMKPPPATFAEMDLVHRGLKRVPQLVNQIRMRGELGGKTEEDKLAFQDSLQSPPVIHPIPGCHLRRSRYALLEIMKFRESCRKKILQGPTDRWLWLVMRKVANLSTDLPSFRNSTMEEIAGWITCTVARNTVGETDGFLPEQGKKALCPLEMWGDILHLCPIAAHTPFDLPCRRQRNPEARKPLLRVCSLSVRHVEMKTNSL
ncbi:hypothetical protein PTMSG1_02249 [Pyrenophora teres f. maculata]|nr:hypothetical protein PTMSG1_02249 [Pyrenophora teres f. maculata]